MLCGRSGTEQPHTTKVTATTSDTIRLVTVELPFVGNVLTVLRTSLRPCSGETRIGCTQYVVRIRGSS
jgi:hypothetical protein